MANASFKVSDTAGLVVRQGVKTFDKTIIGPPGGLSSAIATIPVAGQSFGTILGLFQKCIGIQWGGGVFTVVGGRSTQGGGCFGLPRVGADNEVAGREYFSAVSDSKGENWAIQANVGLTPGGGCFTCSLRGIDTIILAGGFRTDEFVINSLGDKSFLSSPVLALSTDKGSSWTDTGIDRGPIITGFEPNPANPDVEDAITREGVVTAIAYDPQTKLFMITSLFLDDTTGWFQNYYAGDGTGGWGLVGSVATSPADADPSGPFPLPPWAKGSKVCDVNWFTADPFNNPNISMHSDPNVKYCSVNGAGQSMKFTSDTGEETITGVAAPITSAAGGAKKQITATFIPFTTGPQYSGTLDLDALTGDAGAACVSFS